MLSLHRFKQYNLSAWALKHPFWVVGLFVILVVLGAWSALTLPVTRYPDVTVSVLEISAPLTTEHLEDFEREVLSPLEHHLLKNQGLRHVYSVLAPHSLRMTLEFKGYYAPSRALLESQNALDAFQTPEHRALFQRFGLGPLSLRYSDVTGKAPFLYTLSSTIASPLELTEWAQKTLLPSLQSLPGIDSITLMGGKTRQTNVLFSSEALKKHDLSVLEVLASVENLPASQGKSLAATPIPLGKPALTSVPLSTLARLEQKETPQGVFSLLDQKPIVSLAVFLTKGAQEREVSARIDQKWQDLHRQFPHLSLETRDTTVPHTLGNLYSALHTLLEGALLTIVVVFCFLRSSRATMIAAISLPLSILPTFLGMKIFGFSLNLVSLLGITIVTGILVDDAIVEIENIFRHQQQGKTAKQATLDATEEIGPTIIAISLAILAVFIPVSFMSGIAGRFFTHFGVTVSLAVFFSLLVARLVIPLLTAHSLSAPQSRFLNDTPTRSSSWYAICVQKAVYHRFLTVLLGIGIFAISLWTLVLLPTGFLPQEDTSRLHLRMTIVPPHQDGRGQSSQKDSSPSALPPICTSLERGDSCAQGVARDMSRFIASFSEVAHVFAYGDQDQKTFTLLVQLKKRHERTRRQGELLTLLRTHFNTFPWLHVSTVNDLTGGRDVSFALLGPDSGLKAMSPTLEEIAASSVEILKKNPGLHSVSQDSPPVLPDLRLTPKPGLSPEDFRRAQATFSLLPFVQALGPPSFFAPSNPITFSVDGDGRDLLILRDNGAKEPLLHLVEVSETKKPLFVFRQNGRPMIPISADLTPGMALGSVVSEVNQTLHLPAGVSLLQTGDFETMQETFQSFQVALTLGILCVFVILVLLLGHFSGAFVVLASLPLSISGAIFALYLAGLPLDMPVVIGLLMLVGIVTKNAIMLVDAMSQGLERGCPLFEAAIEASVVRVRPILMTTLAMTAGLLPGAFAFGEGGEFRSPMAISVIGGLLLSTALSLFFVPALSVIVAECGSFFKRRVSP